MARCPDRRTGSSQGALPMNARWQSGGQPAHCAGGASKGASNERRNYVEQLDADCRTVPRQMGISPSRAIHNWALCTMAVLSPSRSETIWHGPRDQNRVQLGACGLACLLDRELGLLLRSAGWPSRGPSLTLCVEWARAGCTVFSRCRRTVTGVPVLGRHPPDGPRIRRSGDREAEWHAAARAVSIARRQAIGAALTFDAACGAPLGPPVVVPGRDSLGPVGHHA